MEGGNWRHQKMPGGFKWQGGGGDLERREGMGRVGRNWRHQNMPGGFKWQGGGGDLERRGGMWRGVRNWRHQQTLGGFCNILGDCFFSFLHFGPRCHSVILCPAPV